MLALVQKKIVFKIILLASFFALISYSSYSHEIRIQVVGVQEEQIDIHKNFVSFYQEANSFLKSCKNSALKPECFLFINSDWNFAGAEAAEVFNLNLPLSPTPTRANVLSFIASKIKTAKALDTITLTITGHGHMTKSENSCIALSSHESICAGDLEGIAKMKPFGVRFFINAEGCFSGAFVDIVGPEVCAAVRVDRRNGAISSGGFLWDQVLEKKITSLNQFKGPMGEAYTEKPILASESIKSLMCRDMRMQTYKNWPQEKSLMEAMEDEKPWEDNEEYLNKLTKLPPEKNTRFFNFESLKFEKDHYSLLKLNSLSAGFLDFLKQAQGGFTCKNIGFSGGLCQSLELILSPNFFKEMEQINQLTASILKANSSNAKSLSEKYQLKLKRLLVGQYGVAWREVASCLFNVEQTITREEIDYQDERRSPILPIFPRKFSQIDIEEAQRCESGIHF